MKLFDDLVTIVKRLRADDGCPWDKAQAFQSLTPYIIEEAYELVDSMKATSFPDLKEELGDVLLHVVMLSNMAEEEGEFGVEDVIQDVSDKMIRRHPHVFGDKKAASVDEVWQHWESIKKQEKQGSPFSSIPNTFPALMKSMKVQKKAARLGFDWPNLDGPIEKLTEEVNELKQASDSLSQEEVEDEMGDVLFSIVNIARKLKVNPEEALQRSVTKFMTRFELMLEGAEKTDVDFSSLSLEEMEVLWKKAKESLSENRQV